MAHRRPRQPLPEFTSRAEEAEFWDTHDITEYLDELTVIDRADVTVDRMWIIEHLRDDEPE